MTKEQRKSAVTRGRIETAARQLFSAYGYERTTIRAVAAEANIHASMVMRYFGSKEALFVTVVEFDLRLPDLASIAVPERGTTLVRHFIERWENGGGELPALLRAAVTNAQARDRMARIFDQQLVTAISKLGDPASASRRATLVASQMLGLGLTRYVLKFASAQAISREEIIKAVGATIQMHLTP